MNIQDIVCITLYEVKQKSRRWEFRLFVFFALVGITICHVYWHYHSTNWEASALCCSVPLMNAYLFSVLQSLFLIPIITDFSRSEKPRGEVVCVFTRPLSNMTYTWGKIFGNLILFGLVNVLVVLSCLLFVHIGSIAPYKFGYYLFYSFTITFPSFVFISGLSLWLTRWIRWQLLVIVILSIVWIGSVIWLPYCWHGTFDFLASGIPNLFSDVTGHVGMNHYLLHRVTYFVLGLGLLLLSV